MPDTEHCLIWLLIDAVGRAWRLAFSIEHGLPRPGSELERDLVRARLPQPSPAVIGDELGAGVKSGGIAPRSGLSIIMADPASMLGGQRAA